VTADLRAATRTLPSRLADAGQSLGLRAGFASVRAMPEAAAYRLFDTIADASNRRGGKGVARLRSNYAKVRPDLDAAGLDALVREGMRSYMRYYCDAFRLQDRTQDELGRMVRITGGETVTEGVASGRGAIAFTAHMGNWDTAGAWSSTHLAPLTTVVERLEPEEVFRDFLAFRESLGMTILPLTGGADPFVGLKQAIGRGEFVALVSDRDLTRNGVEVDLCGHRARMAKGPAVLALLTGAPLVAASMTTEVAPEVPGGRRVVIEMKRVEAPTTGTTREKVAVMVQACADHLGAAITAHTSDWHMLQRVFVDDLDDLDVREDREIRDDGGGGGR
jgi:lauroyl/myristoyl acyltransferase